MEAEVKDAVTVFMTQAFGDKVVSESLFRDRVQQVLCIGAPRNTIDDPIHLTWQELPSEGVRFLRVSWGPLQVGYAHPFQQNSWNLYTSDGTSQGIRVTIQSCLDFFESYVWKQRSEERCPCCNNRGRYYRDGKTLAFCDCSVGAMKELELDGRTMCCLCEGTMDDPRDGTPFCEECATMMEGRLGRCL